MQNNSLIYKKCPLFADISEEDMASLLHCLNANETSVNKGEIIFAAGDSPERFGIVLEGSVHVVQEDYWGNRAIFAAVQAGGLFGEAFSYAEADALPVSIYAHEDSTVLLINSRRILTTCTSSCEFHAHLLRNLMKIVAGKNIELTQKMEYLTKKSLRERVLAYFSACALSAGRSEFTIPFNRQELADYLSVERSALSSALGKMRDEGLIDFHKNRFVLLG